MRQRFHLWCSRGKIICSWCFATVQVRFFPKPLQIFGFENYSIGKFYPDKPSNNLHYEYMYAKLHIHCFCYCLLFSKDSFCTLSLYWIDSVMLWQTSRLGFFFMKTSFLLVFMLVQSAPFIVQSFRGCAFLPLSLKTIVIAFISSSLPASCSSILPAHSWFS